MFSEHIIAASGCIRELLRFPEMPPEVKNIILETKQKFDYLQLFPDTLFFTIWNYA